MSSRRARELRSALRGLRRRSEMRALRRALARVNAEGWIVGGALRDAGLGLPIPEIDVAVSREAEAVAAALEAEGVGRAVFLSRDRPGPRVFRVAGRRPIDVAEIEGTILEDLARRDFTVNALAAPVAGGGLLDPYGGLEDLARRRLVAVREENLSDDPLRALRAARFLATHGLVPVPRTLAAARRAAPLLPHVAAERIGIELFRLLGSPRAAPALAWAARARLLPATLGLPISDRSAAFAARCLRALDDAATRRLPEQGRRRLRLALLVLRLPLKERSARAWLASRRLPRREVEEALRLAELVLSEPAIESGKDAWRWILGAGPLAADGVRLLSRLGRRPSAARLGRLLRRRPRRLRTTGEDVMRWLAIPPGPLVGALLRELSVAVACGEVKSRREARHWLSGQVRQGRLPAIIPEH